MSTQIAQLPMPPHYDRSHTRDMKYVPSGINQLAVQAATWRKQHGLLAASNKSSKKVSLLVIDQQGDFCDPKGGSLYVAGRSGTGAVDDTQRLVEFIYRNLGIISEITPTMDSHTPYQVFFTSAHVRQDGSHPEPGTLVSAEDYARGVYSPSLEMASAIGWDPMTLRKQFLHYCQELERLGRKTLLLWPYHCMVGSHGHPLVGSFEEAVLFHAFARAAKNLPEIKGGNPLTEHYSIFRPEVMTLFTNQPIGGVSKNVNLIERLLGSDVVIIGGEAASHCVAWTIADLLTEIKEQDKQLAKKVYILQDCTSSVVISGVNGYDFTEDAEKAFDDFRDAGMHLVNSTTPIQDWPEISL